MTLININLIQELETQSDLREALATSYCYNTKGEKSIDAATFMECVKVAKQADQLLKHFQGLYKECTDFVAGNFEPYIDKYMAYEAEDQFDPFQELYYHFESGTIFDLPESIEQYRELVDPASTFTNFKKKSNEGLEEYLGFTKYYTASDEDGNDIAIPRSEMPEDILNVMDANEEIKSISVEYCLDGYNEFYRQCRALIDNHRPYGRIAECATAILALFAPYNPSTAMGINEADL